MVDEIEKQLKQINKSLLDLRAGMLMQNFLSQIKIHDDRANKTEDYMVTLLGTIIIVLIGLLTWLLTVHPSSFFLSTVLSLFLLFVMWIFLGVYSEFRDTVKQGREHNREAADMFMAATMKVEVDADKILGVEEKIHAEKFKPRIEIMAVDKPTILILKHKHLLIKNTSAEASSIIIFCGKPSSKNENEYESMPPALRPNFLSTSPEIDCDIGDISSFRKSKKAKVRIEAFDVDGRKYEYDGIIEVANKTKTEIPLEIAVTKKPENKSI